MAVVDLGAAVLAGSVLVLNVTSGRTVVVVDGSHMECFTSLQTLAYSTVIGALLAAEFT